MTQRQDMYFLQEEIGWGGEGKGREGTGMDNFHVLHGISRGTK